MIKRLFEVKRNIILSEEDDIVFKKGERVYLEFYGPNGYPLCHGYDVAIDEDEWDEFLEEV